MWKLLINGTNFEIGSILRHRILFGNNEIINEFEVINKGNLLFSIEQKKHNGIELPEGDQILITYPLMRLSVLGYEIYVEQ